jgi:hypothetical protein
VYKRQIRYLAFRQVIIGEYEDAINVIELIMCVCQTSISNCCELYYDLYMYCKNTNGLITNYPKAVERLIDRITTISLSYFDFFVVFSNTIRVLYDKTLDFNQYIIEIKSLALKGYSANDIIEFLRVQHIHTKTYFV